jgi:hypothetical protein
MVMLVVVVEVVVEVVIGDGAVVRWCGGGGIQVAGKCSAFQVWTR